MEGDAYGVVKHILKMYGNDDEDRKAMGHVIKVTWFENVSYKSLWMTCLCTDE